ncbi:MAG: DUF835 domain-containing protein [Thermoplasmata archaeon]
MSDNNIDNEVMDDVKLTAGEKILIYLYDYIKYRNSFEVPFEVTQDGIAQNTGINRSHIPRSVKKFIDKNYIEEVSAHVKGMGRRRKVYFLTPSGIEYAKKIRENISNLNWIVSKKESKPTDVSISLEEGEMYLSKNTNVENIINIYNEKVEKGFRGLIISRKPVSDIENLVSKGTILCLTSIKGENNVPPDKIAEIIKKIDGVINHNEKGIIILDGIEYVFRVNSKDESIRFLDYLHDKINASKGLLVITNNEPIYDMEIATILQKYTTPISYTQSKGIKQLENYLTKNILFSSRVPDKPNLLIGRDKQIKDICAFIDNNETFIIELYGIPKSGKTSIGSEVAHLYKNKKNILWINIYPWSGIRGFLTNFGDFLSSLKRDSLRNVLIKKDFDIDDALKVLVRDLGDLSLIIFIDDYHNAHEDFKFLLSFFMDSFFGNVKIVLMSRDRINFSFLRNFPNRAIEEICVDEIDYDSYIELAKKLKFNEKTAIEIANHVGRYPFILFDTYPSDEHFLIGSKSYSFVHDNLYLPLSTEEKNILKQLAIYRVPVPSSFIDVSSTSEALYNLVKKSFVKIIDNKYSVNKLMQSFIMDTMNKDLLNNHEKAVKNYLNYGNVEDNIGEIIWHLKMYGNEEMFVRTILSLVDMGFVDKCTKILEKDATNNYQKLILSWLNGVSFRDYYTILLDSMPWDDIKSTYIIPIFVDLFWFMIVDGKIEEIENLIKGIEKNIYISEVVRGVIKIFPQIFYKKLSAVYTDLENLSYTLDAIKNKINKEDYLNINLWIKIESWLINTFSGKVSEADVQYRYIMNSLNNIDGKYVMKQIKLYEYIANIVYFKYDKNNSSYDSLINTYNRYKLKHFSSDIKNLAFYNKDFEEDPHHKNTPFYKAIMHLHRFNLYMEKHLYEKAEKEIKEAIAIFSDMKLVIFTGWSLLMMGELFMKEGKIANAEESFNYSKNILMDHGCYQYYNIVRYILTRKK